MDMQFRERIKHQRRSIKNMDDTTTWISNLSTEQAATAFIMMMESVAEHFKINDKDIEFLDIIKDWIEADLRYIASKKDLTKEGI